MLFANAQESGVWGVNTNPNSVNLGTAGVNHSPSSLNLGVSGENSSQNSLNSSPSGVNSSASGGSLGLIALNSSQNALDLRNIAADSSANAKSLGIVAVNSNESGENLGGGNSAPSASSENSTPSSSASSENIVSYELEAVDISAKAEYEEYSSGQAVSREMMDSTSSGNGDISSVLKILPNVKAPNNANSSSTPAELDPANISISGGIPFQNNIQLDGFEMNFDADPGGTAGIGTTGNPISGRPQGLNVDSSLLESIVVLDSNIPAEYGRFGGGVIKADIRKPRTDGWHGNFSAQITNSMLTRQREYQANVYKVDPVTGGYQSTGDFQDDFNKYIFRASLEGPITDTLSVLAAFTTARSNYTKPTFSQYKLNLLSAGLVEGYNYGEYKSIIDANERRTEKRRSDNYFIKFLWKPSDDFNLEYNLAYMPSQNTYYGMDYIDSRYFQNQGGWQTGLKALWSTGLGLWSNKIGYTRTSNQRRADSPYSSLPLLSTADGVTDMDRAKLIWMGAGDGAGAPDTDILQDTIEYKSDFAFEPVEAWISTHKFKIGVELQHQRAIFERLNQGYVYKFGIIQPANTKNNSAAIVGETTWNGQPDEFGAYSSSNDRYIARLGLFKEGKFTLNTLTYAAFLQDDINFDLGNAGDINTRLGVRLDGDNFLNKLKFSPRFSLQYVAPWKAEWESSLTFGANRYYARNLITYRLKALALSTRNSYYRCGPNDSWHADPRDIVLGGSYGGNICTRAANPNEVVTGGTAAASDNSIVSLFSGVSVISNRFDGLEVPYDDELMGAYSQNLGGLFNATFKYIHRDSKDQVMQKMVNNVGYWGNDGWTKSHIFTIALSNIAPIKTGSVEHFYMASMDYTNSKRNFIIYNDDYNLNGTLSFDGKAGVRWEDIRQIYKQPLVFKLNTTHIFRYGKINLSWNNLFTAKTSYKRVIYANETSTNNQYKTHKFGASFNWDMRFGFDADGLYINVDVLNVLDSKKLVPIGSENGVTIIGINSQAMILAYEAGRQFWVQIGYKF